MVTGEQPLCEECGKGAMYAEYERDILLHCMCGLVICRLCWLDEKHLTHRGGE